MRKFVVLATAAVMILLGPAQAVRRKLIKQAHYGDQHPLQFLFQHHQIVGPNMCAVEYVPELSWTFHTDSEQWLRRNVCGFKTQVHFECCEGYTTVYRLTGCSGVLALRDILKTARSMGAGLFVDYFLRAPTARETLMKAAADGAVTLFVPSDEAIRTMSTETRLVFESNLHRNLLYHALPGRVHIKDLPEGDTTLRSLDGYQTPLRILRSSNQVDTVNCHLITRKDHRATNGVVHVIGAVLNPLASSDATLLSVLSADHRFSELYQLLSKVPELVDLLRDPRATLMLMAPTNEAFQAMDPSELIRIQHDYTLAKQFLQLHLVLHPMCAPAIIEKHRVRTVGGTRITISCDRQGVSVNDHQTRFLQDYRFANNGFISVVSKVIVPDPVRTVWDLMVRRDLSLFTDAVRRHGLEHYFSDSTITVFAPNNDAIRSWARQHGAYYDDQLYQLALREFIYNHFVYGQKITTAQFIDGKALYSFKRSSTIRMKVARKWYGVDLAKLVESDIRGSNGVLHIIDRVLTPRRIHFRDWITRDEADNTINRQFVKLIRRSRGVMEELENLGSSNTTASSVTIFAPEDEAFESWNVNEVLNTAQKIEHFVRGHIVHDEIPLQTMSPNMTYFYSTENRDPLQVRNEDGGQTTSVNGASVVHADTLFIDGVLHGIDRFLIDASAMQVAGRKVHSANNVRKRNRT
ncbi:transforming growth factor-beta-induced protein ig-h3-like [Varroa jacobsoni]|uniref:transforming growth factor-beta-induced protein ig-h3-like n=1 Tax=Varroa jacobsoni TaxID=62625 RepID=UPI000BF9A6DD|nr:transforming growth factor-beta-induced protein ig-h3-like [Varroa jacobsoni]